MTPGVLSPQSLDQRGRDPGQQGGDVVRQDSVIRSPRSIAVCLSGPISWDSPGSATAIDDPAATKSVIDRVKGANYREQSGKEDHNIKALSPTSL